MHKISLAQLKTALADTKYVLVNRLHMVKGENLNYCFNGSLVLKQISSVWSSQSDGMMPQQGWGGGYEYLSGEQLCGIALRFLS